MSDALEPTAPKLSTVDKLRLLLDITKTISRSLDLDEVLARARRLETANEEVARRLDAAGLALKTLIADEPADEADEVD